MTVSAPHGLVLASLLAALVVVGIFDARQRRIPNMVLAIIASAGVLHAFGIGGARGALASILGAGAGIALLLFQFKRGWMGAGDVKLLGALGSWAGAMGTFYIFVIGSLLGGALAVLALVRLSHEARRDVHASLGAFARSGALVVPDPSTIARSRGIPFGVALVTAGILVLWTGVGR